jgi:hypothetical protein
MRKPILSLDLVTAALPVAGLNAQLFGYHSGEVRQDRRECRRELPRAEGRRESDHERLRCRHELNPMHLLSA